MLAMNTGAAPSHVAWQQLLFNQSLLGVALLTPDFCLQASNRAWQTMVTNYAGSSCLPDAGQAVYDAIPGEKTRLRTLLQQALTGQAARQETVRLKHNGRTAYWDMQITPLMADGRVTGLLLLVDDNTRHVEIRQQLAQNVADHTEKLNALYDVIAAVTEAPGARATLDWSLERILNAVRCPAGALQIINDFDEGAKVETLRLIAHHGLPPPIIDLMQVMPVDTDLAKQVLSQDESVVIPNLQTRHPFTLPHDGAYVGVPMQVRERIVGILTVFAPPGRVFGEIELALLNSVADQIGIVLENAYLHKQAKELAVLEERNRLARELHDSVTQAIYSLTLFAEAGLRLVQSNNHDMVKACLQRLFDTSQEALKEMRLLLHRLRPPDLEKEGLVGALQQRLEAVEGRANVTAQLLVEGDVEALPEEVEEQLYRIAQEALNNALKHSSASLLTVHIRADEETVELSVVDDGLGFDPEETSEGGMGLQSIEERVKAMEGELVITSAPGEGTAVTVSIDLEEVTLEEETNEDIF